MYRDILNQIASINEDTTMSNIAFIPGSLGTIRAQLANLSKKKKKWKIEILEDESQHTLVFGDDLAITVSNEHWDEFVDTMFDGKENLDRCCDGEFQVLPLTEDREFDIAASKLQDAVTDVFDEPPMEEVDDDVLKFKNLFGIRDYQQVDALVNYNQKEDDLYALLEKVKSAYKRDPGYLDQITAAFREKQPLGTFNVFRAHDVLYGTSVRANYGRIGMRFEGFVSNSWVITERLVIDDPDIIDAIEDGISDIKVSKRTIYPRGRRFDKSFFLGVKNIIDSGMVFQEDSVEGDFA